MRDHDTQTPVFDLRSDGRRLPDAILGIRPNGHPDAGLAVGPSRTDRLAGFSPIHRLSR
jgi:hypothetical protein